MAQSIIMPKTGMAMEEGVILEWKVKEGDRVAVGVIVAEIETDKSTMELESDLEGGTFTVSDIGKFGVTSFTPIINQPAAVDAHGLEPEKICRHIGIRILTSPSSAAGSSASRWL